MSSQGIITGVSGPVIQASVYGKVRMYEVPFVGNSRLLGEVIRIQGDIVDIQVYENTDGLRAGEPVVFTGELLSVKLGPGLLGTVLDGIGRPLEEIAGQNIYIPRGFQSESIPNDREWDFVPLVKSGENVHGGTVVGEVMEGSYLKHLIMIPPEKGSLVVDHVSGEGTYRAEDIVAVLSDGSEIRLSQKWEVRKSRPYYKRLHFDAPLMTGQRILDTLFPLALGGAAVLPGGFGTGKTVTQQSLAKYCNADIIVYIGCGERGNEMTEVLEEFSQLMDPSHDAPLLERMVLIANTSNMPVAAREASIYLGMTIAEYYRDMGYDVAMMADSTSRWAEALREIAGRLEEMPGEEGYPAYLGSRLAQYYERAGRVIPLCGENKEGSVTIINAVSPPGGDFSEPVTQSSLRLAGAFWGLDKQLAQQRHFPAINWNSSYTLYSFQLQEYFLKQMGEEWESLKRFLTVTLDKEKRLKDLVQIVGRDGLSESDKWVLEFADLAKIFFLQQNAFSEEDAWCDLEKQKYMITVLKELNKMILEKIGEGTLFEQIHDFPFRKMLLELRKYSAEEMVVHAEKMYEEIERTVVEQVVE
jgi:V/A-type H+-transporting ATPase subunit A